MKINPQIILLIILCSAALAQLLYWRKKNMLSNTKHWRIYTGVVLVLTVVWASVVRFTPDTHIWPGLVIIVSILWAVVFRWLPTSARTTDAEDKMEPKESVLWLIAIGVVILWGAYLRIAAVDTFSLQSDEYFHANTAMGYLQTGEYVQWNYLTQQPETKYDRALRYTWQVAQSIKVFGAYEWSFRLPTLLWGLLFLLVVPWVAYQFSGKRSIAFFTVAFLAFDQSFIWVSTYSRMYTFFCCIVLLAAWILWKMSNPKVLPSWQRWMWLVLAIITLYFSQSIHATGLLLFGVIPILLAFCALRQPQVRWFRWAIVALLCSAIVPLIFHVTVKPFIPFYLLIINLQPRSEYLMYAFSSLALPVLALMFTIYTLCFRGIKKWSHHIIVCATVSIPILFYLIYGADRYAAKKYSLFVLVFIWMIFATGYDALLRRLITDARLRYIVSIIILCWCFIQFSFPGVQPSPLFIGARADQTYKQGGLHDYVQAYDIIESRAKTGDAFIIQSPKYFYLHRRDVDIYPISKSRQMSVTELQQIMEKHAHGWIVLSTIKDGTYSELGLKTYIEKHTQLLPEHPANLRIYYW